MKHVSLIFAFFFCLISWSQEWKNKASLLYYRHSSKKILGITSCLIGWLLWIYCNRDGTHADFYVISELNYVYYFFVMYALVFDGVDFWIRCNQLDTYSSFYFLFKSHIRFKFFLSSFCDSCFGISALFFISLFNWSEFFRNIFCPYALLLTILVTTLILSQWNYSSNLVSFR